MRRGVGRLSMTDLADALMLIPKRKAGITGSNLEATLVSRVGESEDYLVGQVRRQCAGRNEPAGDKSALFGRGRSPCQGPEGPAWRGEAPGRGRAPGYNR